MVTQMRVYDEIIGFVIAADTPGESCSVWPEVYQKVLKESII